MADGFDPFIELHDEEKTSYNHNNIEIPDTHKEVIRQWILHGSPLEGEVVDTNVIRQYYLEGGDESFPNGKPDAPEPDQGFQIKLGPFFLEPAGEEELMFKYELDLPEGREVTRVESFFSPFSHHFVMAKFNENYPSESIPDGFRYSWTSHPAFSEATPIVLMQESSNLLLPEGTAFGFESGTILDLNTHFINYLQNIVYKCEVYVNVYTQEVGIAQQEMKTDLRQNQEIVIPPDGNVHSFDSIVTQPDLDRIHLWSLMGHAHKRSIGAKVFLRDENGEKGELIYDASCPNGEVECVAPFYDWEHIPFSFYSPFIEVDMGADRGLIYSMDYVNNDTYSVGWGNNEDDEMMTLIMMYVEDTTGLNLVTSIDPPISSIGEGKFQIFPNPTRDKCYIIGKGVEVVDEIRIFDVDGREFACPWVYIENEISINLQSIPKGIYFIQMVAEEDSSVCKVILE